MKDKEIDGILIIELKNKEYYTLENLAEKFKTDTKTIHRSFMRLNQLKHWSIKPHNETPYWRDLVKFKAKEIFRSGYSTITGRNKGQYDHHHAEPYWLRTKYYIRKPD